MKSMKKILACTLATASIAAVSTPANAAVYLNGIEDALLALGGSQVFGAQLIDEPGIFSHQFNFNITLDSAANSVVSTTLLGGNDIDFSSILLDGHAFVQTGFDGPGAETWELSPTLIGAGAHSIFVNGSVVGTTGDGSYSGTLNVTAVPEPATWAMMLLGFAVVGGAMRRRERQTRVRYSVA